MKILHFADLHLDLPFSSSRLPVLVSRGCRLRLRNTLVRLCELSVEEEVDVVTVGGDLFEGDRVSRDTLNFISDTFRQIAPTPVFIAPGNHDYYTANCAYARHNWPQNVHIFRENKLHTVNLAKDIVLYGVAHTTPDERKNFLEGVRIAKDDRRHILLMHGSETSSYIENRAAHAPFRVREIAECGFDFALLGHYHKHVLMPEDNPVATYPGSPQPLAFSEQHENAAVVLEIEGNGCTARAIPTATQSFHTLALDISQFTNTHAVADHALAAAPGLAAEANFLRLKLTGNLNPQFQLDSELLGEQLSQYFDFVDIKNATRPPLLIDEVGKEPTVRGAFVRHLQEMLTDEDDDQEMIRLAFRYGLQAFENENIIIK